MNARVDLTPPANHSGVMMSFPSLLTPILIAVALSACSSPRQTAKTEEKKEPPKPAAPITGRQAFQSTFPSARSWAADAQPVRIRNFNLTEVPSHDGMAGAWEVTYVSPALRTARLFTWAALETQGLQKGVLGGSQGAWNTTRDVPFDSNILGVDTPDLLKTATEKAELYLKAPGDKPPVTFLLENNARYRGAVWRVMWGNSPNTAEYSAFIHPTTGAYLGR